MAIPQVALRATPPSSVCSASHQCQINSNSSCEIDVNSKLPSSLTSASNFHKPVFWGLTCLFPAASRRNGSPTSDELRCSRQDEGDEPSTSLCCSAPIRDSSFSRDHSPVSVFQGALSCNCNTVCSSNRVQVEIRRDKCRYLHDQIFQTGSNVLFNRFLPHASSFCVDYGCQICAGSVQIEPVVDEFELPFAIENDEDEYNAKDLLFRAQARHKIFSQDLVVKAFYEAQRTHRGKTGLGGDPYLQHCVETAALLASIGANSILVASALLLDTLDECFFRFQCMSDAFGSEVTELVQQVSKLTKMSKLGCQNGPFCMVEDELYLHMMFLATVDARAILVKLADRLHNMTTLDLLPTTEQQRFSKETMGIFVPLANRLGISNWKEKLENLSFKYLNPGAYEELTTMLTNSPGEEVIASAVGKLECALKDRAVTYHGLSGRKKSLYSIYSKMLKRKVSIGEIHDIYGLRLIVENTTDCFRSLTVVHHLWSRVLGKFKDYINFPKSNGYQSLHTVVMGEDEVPIEIQIRTGEMHLQAELGSAAHWKHKEGNFTHPPFVVEMVDRARHVLATQCGPMSCDIGDMVKLGAAVHLKSIIEHKKEIERMYGRGTSVSIPDLSTNN